MAGGFRSLLAFWLGGVSAPTTTPDPTPPPAMASGNAMVGGGHRPSYRNRPLSEIAKQLREKMRRKKKRQEDEEELLFSKIL